MDKNTIYGLVAIGVILIGFSIYNGKQEKKYAVEKHRIDSIAALNAPQNSPNAIGDTSLPVATTKATNTAKNDSVYKASISQNLGEMGDALTGEEKFITLENDLVRVILSNKGGKIYSVELKKYKTYGGKPLILFRGQSHEFSLNLFLKESVETGNFYFTPGTTANLITVEKGDSAKSVEMRLNIASNSYLEYKYTLRPGSYMVDYQVNMVNLEKFISPQTTGIDLKWQADVYQEEKGAENENNYTTLGYMFTTNEYEEMSGRKASDTETLATKVQWVAFKQQFFSSIILSDGGFSNAIVGYTNNPSLKDSVLKHFKANLTIPFNPQDKKPINLQFYFGPNSYKTLRAYGHDFQKVVPIGSWIIRWINRYVVIPSFDFLGRYFVSYGLIILLLTLAIKLVLFPLTYKSYLSSAKMRVLKPEVDKINQKYPKKEDALKKQQEVMGLYKKAGASPLGGCLPMVLQFPILFAMFRFFPASIELRQQSFLWADDLSSYDSVLHLPFNIPLYGDHVSLFTLLMAAALFVTSRMSYTQMGDTNAQMPGMKFMMLYLMPIMMIAWFNNYSAGLSYYYFLSNMATLAQTYFIRRFVDDEALLAKLRENSKRVVKKSKFQQRLEDVAREQQKRKK